ncbi:MAG: AraC family transcriptional regulator [Cephaloticoccus sp.]|nr:AraC family transcriptional regulator [Cephaloticoccus sp.]
MARPKQSGDIPRLKATEVFADPNFRLRVMRVPLQGPGAKPHAHEFEELVVIVGGRGTHRIGDEEYPIELGEVFVVLRGMSHHYLAVKGLSLINILYDPRRFRLPRADLGALPGYHALFEIEPRLRQKERFKNRLKLPVDELGQFLNIVAEIERELVDRNPGYRFMATAHFERLLGFISRSYTNVSKPVAQPVTQISEVLAYLERHYAKPLTVEDLARVAGMSPTSLFRLFKEIMDRSPIDYLIHLRIDKAAQLLRRGGLRVGEVSGAVGFNDSNYFARQFRRITGRSPRQSTRQA